MRPNLNWRLLVALHDLYENKKTDAKISTDPYVVTYLIPQRIIKPKLGNNKILEATPKYKSFYEQHFLDDIESYKSFFDENEIPQTANQNYEEEEIEILIALKTQLECGDLKELIEQIEKQGESIHGISQMFFFDDDKYLDKGKESLKNAIKIIIRSKISHFEFANDKDQQYMYKLTHPNPICVVLCENLDFLRKPALPRENRIELWYAGGRNVEKLGYEKELDIPIFYSCDWDWDGLDIFRLVKNKLINIKLLNPTSHPIDRKTTPKHKSEWRNLSLDDKLSGLDHSLFDENQKQIIINLERTNSWLREEKNNLIEMVNNAMKEL